MTLDTTVQKVPAEHFLDTATYHGTFQRPLVDINKTHSFFFTSISVHQMCFVCGEKSFMCEPNTFRLSCQGQEMSPQCDDTAEPQHSGSDDILTVQNPHIAVFTVILSLRFVCFHIDLYGIILHIILFIEERCASGFQKNYTSD